MPSPRKPAQLPHPNYFETSQQRAGPNSAPSITHVVGTLDQSVGIESMAVCEGIAASSGGGAWLRAADLATVAVPPQVIPPR